MSAPLRFIDTDSWTPGGASLNLTCPHCGASPGGRCHTTTGNPCTPHASRIRPLSIAFSVGFDEGWEASKERAEHYPVNDLIRAAARLEAGEAQ